MPSDKKKNGKSHKYNTRGKTKEEEYSKHESSDDDSWETDEEEGRDGRP